MRVLLVNSLYLPIGSGGAERSVSELAGRLIARGHVVAVVTLAPPGWQEDGLVADPVSVGPRVYRWRLPGAWPFDARDDSRGPMHKMWWHLREGFRSDARGFVRAVIDEFKPDVVDTHNVAGFGVAIFREFDTVPWVHTFHDYYLLCPRTTLFRGGTRCQRRCLDCRVVAASRRLPRRQPDEVVGVSRDVVERHIAAGVWTNSGRSVVPNRPTLRAVAPRSVGRIRTVGFIGRIEQAKGVPILFEAFSSASLSSLRLVLAGVVDDDLRDAVSALTTDRRVEEIGVVAAESFYSQVDLVVVPSQWEEPFGRVAAEAGAVGLPVVVSRRGGLPEAVATAKRSAIVDEPDDPAAWIRAIVEAVERWHDFEVGRDEVTLIQPENEPCIGVYDRAIARHRQSDSSAT